MSRRPVGKELSPRERQVYELHCKGYSTAEIARALGGTTQSFVTQAKSTCRKKGYPIPYDPKHFKKQEEQGAANRQKVLRAIAEGHMTVKAIAKSAEMHEATVCNPLAALRTLRVVTWSYGTVTLTAAGREQYKPDDYDEIYGNDWEKGDGKSVEYFERRFDQIAAGRNG